MSGFIYLIRNGDTNYYKIGKSKHYPSSRLLQLNTGNPSVLSIVHVWNVEYDVSGFEKFLHNKFIENNVRTQSMEWFSFVDIRSVVISINEERTQWINRCEMENKMANMENTESEFIVGSEDVLKSVDEYKQMAAQYKILEEKLYRKKLLIQEIIGNRSGIITNENIPCVTWKTMKRRRFNMQGFKRDNPSLYDKYTLETSSRRFDFRR